MNKLALSALTAALALSACAKKEDTTIKTDENGATVESTTTTTDTGAMVPDTTTTTTKSADDGTTTVTTGPNGTSVNVDGKDVDASVGPDGATATVKPDR